MFDSGPSARYGIGVVGFEVECVLACLSACSSAFRTRNSRAARRSDDRRSSTDRRADLLRDRFQRRVQAQQGHRRGEAVVDTPTCRPCRCCWRHSSPAVDRVVGRWSRWSPSGSRCRPSTTARRCLPIRIGRGDSGRRRCRRRARNPTTRRRHHPRSTAPRRRRKESAADRWRRRRHDHGFETHAVAHQDHHLAVGERRALRRPLQHEQAEQQS